MDLINYETGEITGYKAPSGFETNSSGETLDPNDNIIYGYGCSEDTGPKAGYYYIPLECVNCRSRFWEYEPEEYRDYYGYWIKKGTKISDIRCPICGCQTLRNI